MSRLLSLPSAVIDSRELADRVGSSGAARSASIVYVAFVADIYSRAIVGWAAATHKRARLVLDALQMALWRRDRDGHPAGPGLSTTPAPACSTPASSSPPHLIEAGLDASIGTAGDALDQALMESTIGLYKTELIRKDGPWRNLADVELATADYVAWYNTSRPHEVRVVSTPPRVRARAHAGMVELVTKTALTTAIAAAALCGWSDGSDRRAFAAAAGFAIEMTDWR